MNPHRKIPIPVRRGAYESSRRKWLCLIEETQDLYEDLVREREVAGAFCGFCSITEKATDTSMQPCGCPLWDEHDSKTCSPHWDSYMERMTRAIDSVYEARMEAEHLHSLIEHHLAQLDKEETDA